MRVPRYVVCAVALAAAVSGCTLGPGPTSTSGTPPSPSPTVQVSVRWVIDGDTLDVDGPAGRLRLRLVNVNAPEVGRDGAPGECLGAEARDWLRARLPVGTHVELRTYGVDRFGRTLADVRFDNASLSVALTRAGFAAPLLVRGLDVVLEDIEAAADDAALAGTGLHSAKVACTLPGRVAALTAQATAVPTVVTPATKAPALARLTTMRGVAVAVRAELAANPAPAGLAALTDAEVEALDGALENIESTLRSRSAAWAP